MDKEEQRKFVEDICTTLKESMLKNIDNIPENWDGTYFRYYLKDKASEFVWSNMKKPKDYNNDVKINNL